MRILLVNHEFTMSGASVNLLKIADHLVRSGHDCSVLPSRPSAGPIQAEYARRGIPILGEAAFADFAVAICNTIRTGFAVSMAARHTRTVWWIHEAESGLEYILTRPAILRAFYDASTVVFQHEHHLDNVYRSFIHALNPAKFFIVPNGYQIARAGPTVGKTRPIRVAAVGTVYELKRQGDLIRAVHALGRSDVECVFIGRHIALGEAEQRIARAAPDQFKFLGELPHEETLAWLRSSDICCLPSRSESQGGSLFEAALTGNALIATNLPTHRGVWRDGENALLHRVGDVEGLAHAIRRLVDDPTLRLRLANSAAATAAAFTDERFFAGVDRVLTATCS